MFNNDSILCSYNKIVITNIVLLKKNIKECNAAYSNFFSTMNTFDINPCATDRDAYNRICSEYIYSPIYSYFFLCIFCCMNPSM